MREKKSSLWLAILPSGLFISLIGLLIWGIQTMDYPWDFTFLQSFIWNENGPGILLQGLWNTLWISLLSILGGSILGVIFGILLTFKSKILHTILVFYVDVFRNTPFLVQIYVIFFVLGTVLHLSAWEAGILGLILFSAASIAELVRGVLVQFEKGQIMAAQSLGLTPLQIAWHIIFPQAMKRVLPGLVGQYVALIKDSSLISVIGIDELAKTASQISAVTFKNLETWIAVACIYFIINTFLTSCSRLLEQKL